MTSIINQIKKYSISFIALLLNIFLWLWLLLFIKPTGESQVLHYNIYFGIDQLGTGFKLYLMPLFGLVIIAANLLLTMSKLAGRRLALYASWVSVSIQVLLIISLLFLVINHY